jgi:DMSO/TMAO reductase YedYZ heme-binding membrane subunit
MWTWYLTRGSGAAALVLLTASVVIGVAHTLRWRSRALPRFVIDDLHRVLSVSALALVAAHVVTAVLDSFAPVSVLDAFVPFHGVYRPTWLGLGAIAFDLMLILAVTSAYRASIGYRTWRAIHWIAYACWPPALMHSFGTGSDVKRGWILLLGLACAGAVAIAVGARLWQARGPYAGAAKTAGVLGMLGAAGALAAWLPSGPLGRGWAIRAGTPLSLLIPKGSRLAAQRTSVAKTARASRPVVASASQRALTGDASGVIHAGTDPNGTALVDIALRLTNPERRRVEVRIAGAPLDGGGVSLERSQVTFGPPRDPARYLGHLTALSGDQMSARLTPLHGSPIDLHVNLFLVDQSRSSARGRVSVRPIG